ncbi:PIG-L family deacetylase [Pseudomonas sp. RIT-PI-S]|uniref:PIG-L deacetylase family protein n=1 Tax=Pseudomonas sp. RIT-PI-S TaxID=3035295 RepID=UPI0021DA01FB|nr:PIG-L family deacetylase [Pseudomonas sp. RIT-PI-S]
MAERKQVLLRAHRRRKRVGLLVFVVVTIAVGALVSPWAALAMVILCWLCHEAWFADHLFYSPADDYQYAFPADVQPLPLNLHEGLPIASMRLPPGETLILEVKLHGHLLGWLLDPWVQIGDDRQDFERGVRGVRYLNLSGQREALEGGTLRLKGKHCHLAGAARLFVMGNPDFANHRLMVVAPHADDAELSAFGQYQRCAEASIVTLTQGEVEAEAYQAFGLSPQQAAQLKGRLRSWDSLAAPLWGGVKQTHCVQLGYYCLQLPRMAAAPADAFGSTVSGETDVRSVRKCNPLALPADRDGQPTWTNLVADLVALMEHFRPEVLITPHPELDPHPDHVAGTKALFEAMSTSTWKPSYALYYANHLHDNDRWPMGPAGSGIALPPGIEPLAAYPLWSPVLPAAIQLDKAMALGMQHDLAGPLPWKRQVRRLIQRLLAGRRWPRTGENEFFRKSVRRHELFWVHRL